MDQLRQYILRVVIVAILCGISMSILGQKGTVGAMGKLVAGLALTLTVVAPLTQLSTVDFFDYLDDLQIQANSHSAYGQSLAKTELHRVIKTRLEEYIRDEAAKIGASLNVAADITVEESLTIHSITLQGAVSPLHRQKILSKILSDLNISKEKLLWEN